ncbi:MAG: thiamine pyrophosphate-dependent enzyme [bacterium]
MPLMTGGEAIVRSLIAQGVNTLFALPGVQNDPLFVALHDAAGQIRVVHTRHEQGAAYMAYGYAAATGGAGAYAVVPGPGFLNTTAALSTAYAANARVLCLTGQIPSKFIGRGAGFLHEIPDQLGVMRALTKWAARIETPADTPARMAEAFGRMFSGRPRPVGLEMAMDQMAREQEVGPPMASPTTAPPEPDADAIAAAAKILGRAKRPLLFVGGGAAAAGEQVAALAELLQAPVIATPAGLGVLSSRHPFSHAMPAGHRLWAGADAVLAVGTRLFRQMATWGLDDALPIVRVDIDPDEPARLAAPAVAIVADAAPALTQLLAALEKTNQTRPDRRDEMTTLREEVAASIAGLEPQLSFLKVIREELPDDGIFVEELTQVGYASRFAFPVYSPRTYIDSGYQGTLGWGFAGAIGAKIAHPGRQVISISGDGGFLFNAQELATAVHHRVALVALVFNDGAFGNVKRMQKEDYGGRLIASELTNPDFVKLAESFGAQGLRAKTPEQLRAAIRRGFAGDGPTLIEIPVGEMASPWPHVVFPKVRG